MTDWPRHQPSDACEPSCFGCRLLTVRFDKADERSMAVRERDKKFDKDAAAYKRLRAEGLQPRGVDQSAMAEKLASHSSEIQLGRSMHKEEVKAFTRELTPIK